VPRALRLGLKDAIDELFLAILGSGLHLEVATDPAELDDAHLEEVADIEVVPLAGGLELLHLVEFTDRRAADRVAAARTPITWTLIGTGHRRRATCTCKEE
jgi:hypothetical protein